MQTATLSHDTPVATPPHSPVATDAPSAKQVLFAALGVGILGDQLLRSGLTGIGPAIWVIFAITTLRSLTAGNATPTPLQRRLLLGSMTAVALLLTIRDADGLTVVPVLSLIALLFLTIALSRGDTVNDLRSLPIVDTINGVVRTWFSSVIGAMMLVFRDLRTEDAAVTHFRHRDAVIRGLAITIPVAFIFISLFAAADSTFENLVGLMKLDIGELLGHVVLTGILTYLTAGLLRHATRGENAPSLRTAPIQALGIVEVAMLLGTLTFVFTIFVALQLPRMFAGEEYIVRETGLTYASYARRGFFELILASGLTLGVLAGLRSVVQLEERTLNLIRMVGGVLVGLVFVILLSAVHRFALYVDAYGWTEDRIYCLAIIAWLSVCFAHSFGTLLGNRPERFIAGAVAAALVTVASLVVVNPQAMIVHQNAQRARAGHELDLAYIGRALGRDAAPALAEELATFPSTLALKQEDCAGLTSFMNKLDRQPDWRAWTYSAWRAQRAKPAIETWRARHCSTRASSASASAHTPR